MPRLMCWRRYWTRILAEIVDQTMGRFDRSTTGLAPQQAAHVVLAMGATNVKA
jgi:hypothetical protein